MKRAVFGTHHSISEAHLHRYLVEWDFKFNWTIEGKSFNVQTAHHVTRVSSNPRSRESGAQREGGAEYPLGAYFP